MKWRFLYLTIILFSVLTLITSCGSKKQQEAQAQSNRGPRGPLKVDGYIAQTKPVSEKVQLPGTLVAEDQTDIHPEVSGRITGLFIKEGAYVTKGTLLGKL